MGIHSLSEPCVSIFVVYSFLYDCRDGRQSFKILYITEIISYKPPESYKKESTSHPDRRSIIYPRYDASLRDHEVMVGPNLHVPQRSSCASSDISLNVISRLSLKTRNVPRIKKPLSLPQ
jgi:hypothetical protein